MSREYTVKRKLQEQSGSYFVTLPKIWVEAEGLKEGDIMSVVFNDIVKIKPPPVNATTLHGVKAEKSGSDRTGRTAQSQSTTRKGGEI